ncbi:hypothetical protein XBLMG947_0989 [Xanthomonas bromi]|uniref:Uncharacterized protein n=1 Tax=Xanthomonas bromi TaxID=56449 RepID=A0A1C3NIH3_9XANT|nr:hypothetical protein [Xanthomonas bromi]SBV50212.1 hypothetical protein XBLMG947_0989 [Xanthomonas bromi]
MVTGTSSGQASSHRIRENFNGLRICLGRTRHQFPRVARRIRSFVLSTDQCRIRFIQQLLYENKSVIADRLVVAGVTLTLWPHIRKYD